MNGVAPVWVVVPVRDFVGSKSRLAPLLSLDERSALSRAMLEDVLGCLGRSPHIEGVAIVTDNTEAMAVAARQRAHILPDAAGGDGLGHSLNASLENARAWLRRHRPAVGMLVLPADIPAATPDDIASLIESDSDVVLARADDGGTNALRLAPNISLPFSFGPDSFARHCAAAAALRVRIVHRAGLSLDIDRPDDIASYLAQARDSRTLDILRRLDIATRLGSDARRGVA